MLDGTSMVSPNIFLVEILMRHATSADVFAKRSACCCRRFLTLATQGFLAGTRELVVGGLPYIVVHRIERDGDTLVILGVYHGAQLRPGQQIR